MHGPPIEPSAYTRWYSTCTTDQNTIFDLGSITYGQSKDLLIPVPLNSSIRHEFTLIYDTLQEKKKSINININTNPQLDDVHRLIQQKFRLQLVHCVRTACEAARQETSTNNDQNFNVDMTEIKQLEEEMGKYLNGTDEYVKDLLADLAGQVQEALSKKDWFKKWGVHFLPSLTRKF